MGRRNVLIEGVSGAGKTAVCDELRRRGVHAVHGDRELAYQGDPTTGAPLPGFAHEHHIWSIRTVTALVADRSQPVTFLCGGARNHAAFLGLLDAVIVLRIDAETQQRRLAARPEGEWGHRPEERELAARLHASGEDLPDGVAVDSTRPLAQVVDTILALTAVFP